MMRHAKRVHHCREENAMGLVNKALRSLCFEESKDALIACAIEVTFTFLVSLNTLCGRCMQRVACSVASHHLMRHFMRLLKEIKMVRTGADDDERYGLKSPWKRLILIPQFVCSELKTRYFI